MLKAFNQHIVSAGLFSREDHLLLAISGGIDSVVLATLLKAGGYKFSLAHCNFKLRKKDSEYDEDFCRQLAKKLDVKIYVKEMNVKAYQEQHKMSLQMAARELRYLWFKELIEVNQLDYLVTAHHGNDVIETTFINLLRGTGINGLKGIPEKAGQIVRPLLHFNRAEIIKYASENEISFRMDKSNSEDKYERNFLRLNIIPGLKKFHPRIENTILKNVAIFKEEAAMVNDFLEEKQKHIVTKNKDFIFFDRALIVADKYRKSLLHFLLSPYGFNASQLADIEQNICNNGLVGKILNSPTCTLTIDRHQLVMKPHALNEAKELVFDTLAGFKKNKVMKVSRIAKFKSPAANEIVVEAQKLVFPVSIRARRTGDKFRPFGMKGFKLLSDFLKEKKLNNFEKEKCRLLVNGNGEIIWVIGYRSDERYKVEIPNGELLKITLSE